MTVRETLNASNAAPSGNILAALMTALTGGEGYALVERNGELFLETSAVSG